jgi:hypothetical protein
MGQKDKTAIINWGLEHVVSVINYYEILEIKQNASSDEIKAAYKKMVALVHPDKGGSAMLFRLVQSAYDVLSDPNKRRAHDAELAGPPRHEPRPGGHQQHQDAGPQDTDPKFVRIEDLYRKWKEERNRVSMPRSESVRAGGVRKMIRQTALYVPPSNGLPISKDKVGDLILLWCGNCGFDSVPAEFATLNPFQIVITPPGANKTMVREGETLPNCKTCNEPPGVLRRIRWPYETGMSEAIEIETGDLILFQGSGGILRNRLVFGEVTQGIARNEFGLRQIKVADEFSGKTLSPKGWNSIVGVWKSNSLSQRRTKSVRNWSFQ